MSGDGDNETPDQRSDPVGMPAGSLAPGLWTLIPGYVILILAPLAAAWMAVTLAGPFWPATATALALVGYAMLLVQFVLSGRFQVIGGRIGIDLVMRFHQLAARTLVVLLLLHPFLYSAPQALRAPAAYFQDLAGLFTAPALLTGVAAWVLLIVLAALSLWRAPRRRNYEAWRVTHGFGALLIAGLGLHHAFAVGGLTGQSVALRSLWVVMFGIAALTLLGVYVLRPLMLRQRPWRVAAVRAVGPGRWLLLIRPEGAPLAFRAGQFAWLKLGPNPFTVTEHPFSFASAPGAGGAIEFLIREAGDFTDRTGSIEPGTRAWLDGPHGAFVLPPPEDRDDAESIVLLAGGVGLAPILSILREAAARRDPRAFHLVYGNRIEAQVVLREEIEALKLEIDLTTDYVLSEPPDGWDGAVGQMGESVLHPLLSAHRGVPGTLYYLCGPPGMVAAGERALGRLGIAPGAIIAERFEFD